jgi:hypothetical protein
VPTSVVITTAGSATGVVGQALASAPRFVVDDQNGRAMDGVRVAVAVVTGNGSLAGAPSTSRSDGTSIGAWTLGPTVGANQVTVTVDGLAPLTISAMASAGAVARIVPSTVNLLTIRVGEIVTPAPSAIVTDAFGNAIAGAAVSVSVVGGGSAPATAVTDTQGMVTVAGWSVGTIVGQNVLTLTAGAATTSFIANVTPGDPAALSTVSGDRQTSRAGTPLVAPILLRLADRYGNVVGGHTVTVVVSAGGGSLAGMATTSATDGMITLPIWTLGRSAVPQSLHVSAAELSADISATVATAYHIDVRFFGPEMSDAQKALFNNAAARLSAIVTGDVPDLRLTNVDLSNVCGIAGLPTLNETIDDIVIYASVQHIDGPSRILAQSGPCILRNQGAGYLTAAGVMAFDDADIDASDAQGLLQGVITHEMLHVLGVGTLWSLKGLLQAPGTAAVTYLGAAGRQGCVDDGGGFVCGSGVPVENNGVEGTADAHWRESVFQSELMTGYVNFGGMPLSAITVGSLADMGYVVDPFAADPFQVPGAGTTTSAIPTGARAWERPLPARGVVVEPNGTVTVGSTRPR